MDYATLITKDYTILVTKRKLIDPTIEQIDQYFNEVDNFLSTTSGPCVFLSYNEKVIFISAEARAHIGTRARLLVEKYLNRIKATILVSSGVVDDLMIKEVSSVYKTILDSIVVGTLEEAYEKAKQLLDQLDI